MYLIFCPVLTEVSLKQREAVTEVHGVSKPFAFVYSSLRVQYTHKNYPKILHFYMKASCPFNYTQVQRLKQNPFQIIVNAVPDSAAAVAFEQYDAFPPPRGVEKASSAALSTFVNSRSIKQTERRT